MNTEKKTEIIIEKFINCENKVERQDLCKAFKSLIDVYVHDLIDHNLYNLGLKNLKERLFENETITNIIKMHDDLTCATQIRLYFVLDTIYKNDILSIHEFLKYFKNLDVVDAMEQLDASNA